MQMARMVGMAVAHPRRNERIFGQRRPQFTPDQAEAEVRAKAAPEGTEFANCFELIAEARKPQERSRDRASRSATAR
jgi:hypothetical protein